MVLHPADERTSGQSRPNSKLLPGFSVAFFAGAHFAQSAVVPFDQLQVSSGHCPNEAGHHIGAKALETTYFQPCPSLGAHRAQTSRAFNTAGRTIGPIGIDQR